MWHKIAVRAGTAMEVDSDSDDHDEPEAEPDMTRAEMLQLCQKLEHACLGAEVDGALDLSSISAFFVVR